MTEEAVDFEPDDVMEEEAGGAEKAAPKRKGRGKQAAMDDERYSGRSGIFESLDTDGGSGPARCTSALYKNLFDSLVV